MRRAAFRFLATLLAVVGLAAAPRRAQAENELSIRVSNSFAGGGSGLYASGGSSVLTEAEFGYGHDLKAFGPAHLWLEGNWMVAQRAGDVFGLRGNLLLQRLTVGARVGFAVPRAAWLVPHVRVGVGTAIGQYGLSSGGVSASTSDWEAAFAGHALAGVELLIPRPFLAKVGAGARGVTAGLVIDGGLSWATPLRFSTAPDGSGDTVRSPASGTSLGTLDLTAGVLRIGAVLWF